MFTRTFSCKTSMSKEALRSRLVGNHVNIHNLDFEVVERNDNLRIIPHAEQIDEIKSLPITYVELDDEGGETKVKITSKMRKLDTGAPMLIFIVCSLLPMAALVLLMAQEYFFSGLLILLTISIYATFRFRLEKSYFDYVRKIHQHVVNACSVAHKSKTAQFM